MPKKHENPVTPEEEAENLYRSTVQKHMIHKCAVASNGCKSSADAECKKGYARELLSIT
jgi:hypothetical protein